MIDASPTRLSLAPGVAKEYLVHHRVCPRAIADGALVVAAAPGALTRDASADLAAVYGLPVTWESASEDEVHILIERLAARSEAEAGSVEPSLSEEFGTDARALASQPPVIRYVNLLLREAIEAHASDIHLEVGPGGLQARYRLDGVLEEVTPPPSELGPAVLSRVKLLAELDIAERRRPQDGRLRFRVDARHIDVRVATVPTLLGESIVLRLRDRSGGPAKLEGLGMPSRVLQAFERLALRPHGMIVVTGPTGSGKTTTLYAALARRRSSVEKVITVEDPVEHQLPGVTQVPVASNLGVTFASALRSILRHDPDVLLVGDGLFKARRAQVLP